MLDADGVLFDDFADGDFFDEVLTYENGGGIRATPLSSGKLSRERYGVRDEATGTTIAQPIKIRMAQAFVPLLFTPNVRYRVAYGGRGGAKSWSFAQALVVRAHQKKELVLCTREYQNSIADSVHRVIAAQIRRSGLSDYFNILKSTITHKYTGSEFIFKGLRMNADEIRSTEGVTIAWVAEAHATAEDSFKVLTPTIRRPDSEIWIDFNTNFTTDPVYKRFVVNPPPRTKCIKVGWQDNPWFPQVLEEERRFMLGVDPHAYDWVWEGMPRTIGNEIVFYGRFEVREFETPEVVDRFYFGADWGFANDPSVLVRSFIKDECLYIDYEAYGVGIEIDDLPVLFKGGRYTKSYQNTSDGSNTASGIPGADVWPIKADSARPETISYVRRHGNMNISAAEKWPGCVEDRINHLKAFRKIIIHPRCVRTAQEFRLYSYKTDPRTGDVLPVLIDKHNHCIDAIGYSLDGFIQRRGKSNIWTRLAG